MNVCPHTLYCRRGCNNDYLNCYIYSVIENFLNYQQKKVKLKRRIYKNEHKHKQYEKLPYFGRMNLIEIINNLLEK